MNTIKTFISVYRMYRKHHPARYAAHIAWQMAVNKTAF